MCQKLTASHMSVRHIALRDIEANFSSAKDCGDKDGLAQSNS
jgi:hypothetical protein